MASKVVVLDDFSGGDAGRERPQPGDLTHYRGVNTWVYPNGAIGPRPPAQRFTNIESGLPTGKSLRRFDISLGQSGLWYAFAFSDGQVWTVGPGLPMGLRGTLAFSPTDSVTTSGVIYYVSDAGAGGGLVKDDGAFSTLPNMPIASLIESYGDRLVTLSNTEDNAPLLRFSSAADPTTWAAVDSQSVGAIGVGCGLYVQRDALIIVRWDGSIWSFTGVIGFNENLRQVDVARIPPVPARAKGATVSTSILYYTTGHTMTAFTGATAVEVPRPDFVPVSGFTSGPFQNHQGIVLPAQKDQTFLVLGTLDGSSVTTNKTIWMQSFAPETGWNRHKIPVTTYSISAAFMDSLASADSARAVVVAQKTVEGFSFFAVPSDSAGNSTVRVYFINTLQERPYLPPGVSLTYANATFTTKDADTTLPVVAEVQFAEWWAPDGSEVLVRSVIVDYTYDSDAAIAADMSPAVPNRFDIAVEATQVADGSAANTSTTIAFVPTGGSAVDTDGSGTIKRGRELFQFGDQGRGGGFRIRLSDWRGITIHRLTAVVDVTERRD